MNGRDAVEEENDGVEEKKEVGMDETEEEL